MIVDYGDTKVTLRVYSLECRYCGHKFIQLGFQKYGKDAGIYLSGLAAHWNGGIMAYGITYPPRDSRWCSHVAWGGDTRYRVVGWHQDITVGHNMLIPEYWIRELKKPVADKAVFKVPNP